MRHLHIWLCLTLLALFPSACKKKEPGSAPAASAPASSEDEFIATMNSGKNYYDSGSVTQAVAAFTKAVAAQPTHHDAQLNMANAHLLAGDATNALKHAQLAIKADNNSAAAHFVAGCAFNRLNQPLEAIKELQISRDLDPTVAAAAFQLGLAHLAAKQLEEAAQSFQAAIDLEPEHPSAHFQLGQALVRAGRADQAQQSLATHQQIAAAAPAGPPPTPATFERSKHTAIRVPFKLEQPAREGIKVAFVDATPASFTNYSGPVGILDVNHRGANDLFVFEKGAGFRLLLSTNNTFQPLGEPAQVPEGNIYHRALVADLQNDRFEDVLVLGEKGGHVFRFGTNGGFTEATRTRLEGLAAIDGALVDLDFTGKLDLLVVTAVTNDLRLFRNLGNLFFRDITATSGIPTGLNLAKSLTADDLNNDDILDFVVGRQGQPPAILLKERGGSLVATNINLPAGVAYTLGDLNNDLHPDTIVATTNQLEIIFGESNDRRTIENISAAGLKLSDYDNDGWLDIVAFSDGIRILRNRGREGFAEAAKIDAGKVVAVHFADFDNDCDSDLLAELEGGGLKLFRNDGGNANRMVKIQLYGNRSNASGLGVKLEAQAGGLRTTRTVTSLPVEIGVGKYETLETLTVRWFDLAVPSIDLKVECTNLLMAELILPTGSCPYLYVWDGAKYRFVTDLLGAAPLGLPVAEGIYIEADPDEFVLIGDESTFKPRHGAYEMQVTEELREALYLDEAKLVVVDHPPGTEVHSTDKLVPGPPFPPGGIVTLGARKPLLAARNHQGTDITEALRDNDRKMASPTALHIPQRRGMAEPHTIELDFGALDTTRPLALALTGWLRFGGGMANIAASHHPDLPFPFPVMEIERNGAWEKVDVLVGAPAGKTKTIVVDLDGKLPAGARRMRITASFEIHWDRAALFEKVGEANTRVTAIAPTATDLHWRGFSDFENLPWTQPLTPDYARANPEPKWRLNVSGWCTRYGPVEELIAKRDNALAIVNAGDELTLRFDTSAVPAKATGQTRHFFIYIDGWDKDADFHVATGTRIEPMPFHGMNYQRYAQPQQRPPEALEAWIEKYNTRWVGPLTLRRGK